MARLLEGKASTAVCNLSIYIKVIYLELMVFCNMRGLGTADISWRASLWEIEGEIIREIEDGL